MFAVLSWMMMSFAAGFGLATAIISYTIAELFALTVDSGSIRIDVHRNTAAAAAALSGEESSVDARAEEERSESATGEVSSRGKDE